MVARPRSRPRDLWRRAPQAVGASAGIPLAAPADARPVRAPRSPGADGAGDDEEPPCVHRGSARGLPLSARAGPASGSRHGGGGAPARALDPRARSQGHADRGPLRSFHPGGGHAHPAPRSGGPVCPAAAPDGSSCSAPSRRSRRPSTVRLDRGGRVCGLDLRGVPGTESPASGKSHRESSRPPCWCAGVSGTRSCSWPGPTPSCLRDGSAYRS